MADKGEMLVININKNWKKKMFKNILLTIFYPKYVCAMHIYAFLSMSFLSSPVLKSIVEHFRSLTC